MAVGTAAASVGRGVIVNRVVARLQGTQRFGGGRIGCRRVEARQAQVVGDQRPRAPGRGEDRDAVAAQLAAGRERHGNVEQVAD